MNRKLGLPMEDLISLQDFCNVNGIESSFVEELQTIGLIDIIWVNESGFINSYQMPVLERIFRFRYELDINIEGIQAIHYLLDRISRNEGEITILKNRLRFYEPPIYA